MNTLIVSTFDCSFECFDIAHLEKVLNGKGRVILYENIDSAGKWFYR